MKFLITLFNYLKSIKYLFGTVPDIGVGDDLPKGVIFTNLDKSLSKRS